MELARNQQHEMDDRQKQIAKWLTGQDQALGELYEGAVRMLRDRSFLGRLRFICYSVREIRNRLPEAVAGKSTIGRLDYMQRVEELAKACERAGLGSVRVVKENKQGPEQKVTQEVVVQLSDLVAEHKAIAGRKRENAKRLLIALEPENKSLQASLVPVVSRWIEETDWFEERAHIGKVISEDDLVAHFEGFERVLLSLVGYFYQGLEEIEQIIEKINKLLECPSEQDVSAVILRLGRIRYRTYFFDKIENPHWIEPLREAGFFKSPAEPAEGEAYERWPEGHYLKRMAPKAPDEVLEIIRTIETRNPWVINICVEILLEMPEEIAAKGVKVIQTLFPRDDRPSDLAWFWEGKQAAELMVKLARSHREEAFKIAWVLVDAWGAGEVSALRDMTAKFKESDYEELIFKYYNKLFEIDAERATGVLVKILSRYVQDASEKQNYDVSSLFYVSLENLEEIDRRYAGVLAILVKGICEGGRVVIEKQTEKVKELLDYLESLQKAIFYRVEMYLLRFVPKGVETERIRKIISNKKYLEEPGYKYEYKLLLRDKFDEAPEARQVFEKRVDEQKVDDVDDWKEWFKKVRDKEPTKEDLEKYEAGMKARALFLVKGRYPELYEKYKKESGLNDAELAPRRMVGEVRHVSPMEGTPLAPEAMGKMTCDAVLDYILEPKNYESKKKAGEWRDTIDALRSTFKEDVKKRPSEYLKCDVNKLKELPAQFLASFFYGVEDAVREGSFNKEEWELLISFASLVVEERHEDEKYRDCFSEILSVLREGFGGGKGKLELDESTAKQFWEILKRLIRFPVKDMKDRTKERDPIQLSLRHVAGKATELTVLLGLVCKKQFEKFWEKELKAEMRECWEYVLKNIREPGINCTFGIEFSRIYWLDSEWVEQNLDEILRKELWDEIWGTYVSWGGPSPDGFKLLVEKGKYGQAVEKLGKENEFQFQKNPEEGLVEHMMIGFFNGWIDFEHEVLKQFFKNAPAELRGKAAEFLTTGFKSVNEEGGTEEKKKVAARMREYWNKRLAAIEDKPEENNDEAVELTGWVEDSVLPAKETLELLEKSLDLSGGKIGRMRDARDFVEGVSKLGKGNELLALRCLKKAAVDENMHMAWSGIQKPLVNFLETMVDLPKDVRGEAKEVADAYGRYNPEKFRSIWERLSKEAKR